jgi:hypothetical protein
MKGRRLVYRALIAFAFSAILAALPAAARVYPVDPAGLARAVEVQERHTDQLMAMAGVVGTAVGVRTDGKHVVKIFTETAGVAGLPRDLDGIPVQVQVTGKIFALHHRPDHSGGPGVGGGDDVASTNDCPDTTAKYRPACIGISTGHPDMTAGTIGARVKRGSNVYALSNNHVYANENLASNGASVLQPGAFDGGSSPADNIGTLSDFEPIVFSTNANNIMDAAIAQLSSPTDVDNATPSDGYGTPESSTVSASVGMRVMKYGRTTGLTKGRVDAINATVNVQYDQGVARFINQIIIRPGAFSAGGDSGSLIVAQGGPDNRKAVGLLFAGSFFMTVANPIDAVLDRFGVSIDGQ